MYIYKGKINWKDFAINEPFTLIVPDAFIAKAPISAYWLWTKSPEDHDTTVAEHTYITTQPISDTETKVSFALSNSFTFEATLPHDGMIESLSFTVSDQSGDVSSVDVTLSHSYCEHLPQCRIYNGTFSWTESSRLEMLFIVIPRAMEAGAEISAFWGNDESGINDVEKSIIQKITDVQETAGGKTISFTQNNLYKFSVDVIEKGEQLQATLEDAAGRQLGVSLKLNQHPDIMIWETISTLVNDTNDTLFCLLTGIGSGDQSKVIAGAGMAIAVFGLIPFALAAAGAATASTVVSVIAAGLGVGMGSAGIYDAFSSSEYGPPVADILYPGQKLSRTSSWNVMNNATVIRFTVSSGTISIRFGFKAMGSGDKNLSQLLASTDYFTILQQTVATGVTPEILRSFQLRLTPTADYKPNGVTITDIDTGDIPNRGIISGTGTNRKKFETITPAGIADYANVLGNTAFDWRRGTHMLLIQLKGSNVGGPITSIEPPSDTDPSRTYVWVLRGFTIRNSQTETGRPSDGTVLKWWVTSEDEAKGVVYSNLGRLPGGTFYQGFEFGPTRKVIGFQNLGAIVRREGYTAFVPLRSIVPLQRPKKTA
ncbi:hypothetical protein AX17_003637 [Amanita inopinata Kibby_2008]|nr:hypothetical protein AX17_003637 [Amanita inopinata Kibby_2008]